MKCKHLWEHKVEKGLSLNKQDKKVYEWLIHKCKHCGKRVSGGKLV